MRSLRWVVVVLACFGMIAISSSLLQQAMADDGATAESGTCYCADGEACPCCLAAKGATLCGKCGHEKGSEACCADGCETCEKCGKHAGSLLCCKVDGDADICAACGHEAGSDACCSDDCKTCECGMHAGSALCCKLEACACCADGLCGKCMAASDIVLCGTCGHVKGGPACCSDDCEKCDCGMHAGSPLCCKVDKDNAGKDLCTKCGHEAGEDCCGDDCETCEKCGMHAGSALCCKLNTGG